MPLTQGVLKLLAFLAFFAPQFGFGQSALVWEHRQVEVRPALGEKQAKAEFNFTNACPHPVTIDSVKSSCGCTTATLDKKTYLPGEKGHIDAVFSVGNHHGVVTKGIQVTVHGESDPTVLFLTAHVPETIKIDPPLLVWNAGEKPETKRIALSVSLERPMRILKVSSSNPVIGAVLETVKEGREYSLAVHPKSTDKAAFAILRVEVAADSKEIPQPIQAFAKVIGLQNPKK